MENPGAYISIGPDQWIAWMDPGYGTEMFSLDEPLSSTQPFWDHLESHCITACCGIDALDFWPESIKEAKEKDGDPDLKMKLEKLRVVVAERPETLMCSSSLNQVFHRDMLVQLLDHIISCL
jgi:hypothetical protein